MSGEVNMDGTMGDKCGPPGMTNTLAEKLKCLMGQQVTVYMYEMELTGMLHGVGMDYIEPGDTVAITFEEPGPRAASGPMRGKYKNCFRLR